jgi:hypothetical protein
VVAGEVAVGRRYSVPNPAASSSAVHQLRSQLQRALREQLDSVLRQRPWDSFLSQLRGLLGQAAVRLPANYCSPTTV